MIADKESGVIQVGRNRQTTDGGRIFKEDIRLRQ
jgi:hypothetical protein